MRKGKDELCDQSRSTRVMAFSWLRWGSQLDWVIFGDSLYDRENGGGAFLFIYMICAALIALPILIAELVLGQQGQDEPWQSMRHLTQRLSLGDLASYGHLDANSAF